MGHRLVDDVAELLATMPDRRVAPGEMPTEVQELLGTNRALPEDGTDPEALLKETTNLLFDHSLFNGHPRFFGYITSSPAPIGILGDFLASAINPNTGGWMLSPLATEIERQSVAWIAELLGYPTDCGGLLVSGGNMANMVGRIHDDRAAGDQPFMVVGTGGSVSTGLVDPLPEIAALCREEDLWFHVDGAYGGFAAASPDAPDELRALSEADSVAVDPHKWLYAPLEAGCALVRNPDHLRDAFSYQAPYYHFGLEAISFVDYGPQNSRGIPRPQSVVGPQASRPLRLCRHDLGGYAVGDGPLRCGGRAPPSRTHEPRFEQGNPGTH